MDQEFIQFNVGGTLFPTTKSTLNQHPDTLLTKLVTTTVGVLKDHDGNILIDRNPKYFNYILDYYRLGSESIHELPTDEKTSKSIKREYEYFLLTYPIKPEYIIKMILSDWIVRFKDGLNTIFCYHYESYVKINNYLFYIRLFKISQEKCSCDSTHTTNGKNSISFIDDHNNHHSILELTNDSDIIEIYSLFRFNTQFTYRYDAIMLSSYLLHKALVKNWLIIENLLKGDIETVEKVAMKWEQYMKNERKL